MNLLNKHLGLFTDHYELTMAEGYFMTQRGDLTANFDYFFRKNPFNSGFTIFAGLQDLLEMIHDFKFDADTIDYLHKCGFTSDFLEYLKNFYFQGNIYAPNEGEIVFPNEPTLSMEGTIIETQLLETLALNTLNFQSLIATKANRLRYAAGERSLMDFGMRRAQGWAAIHASRAAIIGGVNATSNVLSAFLYDLTSAGTQAHSWIQSFDDELTAFRKFAETHPNDCVLLVDTYNTLKSGLPNAIIVAKEMIQRNQKLTAIRLDSGDFAYLSKKARMMLDAAGLNEVKIIVSNQLDEYLIKSLISQDAPIDGFGVGTSLVTGQNDAALDGVYKLSMIDKRPTIKLSEDPIKISLPGKKKIVRYFDADNKFYADAIALSNENDEEISVIFHPQNSDNNAVMKNFRRETIVSKVSENGNVLIGNKSIQEISDYRKYRISQLPEEYKRFEFPHIYKVGLSNNLKTLRDKTIAEIRKNS